MTRVLLMSSAIAVALTLSGCSAQSSTPSSQLSESAAPEPIVDERFEAEPFSRLEKVDICTQVSDLAGTSDVLYGNPRLDVVEESEWFCRIDGIEWTKLEANATIELGFREYSDHEIQKIQDDAANNNSTSSTCNLITFYEGDLVFTDSAGTPHSCWLQTTIHHTTYMVRNSTAITLKLQLDGSPQEHNMVDLDGDDSAVYRQIMELIDQY